MKKKSRVLIIIILMLIMTGCSSNQVSDEEIKNIESILNN